MSGSDLALVAVVVVALGATAALTVAVVQLRSSVAELERMIERFSVDVLPIVTQSADSADRASAQVQRLEDILGVAAAMTDTMDSATATTVRVLSNPVIKTAAVAKGTRRAARRLASKGDA